MNNIASFSPFESPKGLIYKYSVPQHLKIPCRFRVTMYLEVWGQEDENVMYWFFNNNFTPIKFIDHVEFSVLLMVEMTLAKNWCAK